MKKSVAAICILALGIQPVTAEEASIFCTYDYFLGTHAIEKGCGKPLDSAAEARYQKLVLDLATFIVENSPALKGKTDPRAFHAARAKRYDDARFKAEVCQNTQLVKFAETAMARIRQGDISRVTERLKTPSDPMKGPCL